MHTYEIPKDANILGGRYILLRRQSGTQNKSNKAIFVVQRHKDKDNTLTLQISMLVSFKKHKKNIIDDCKIRTRGNIEP